MTVEEAIIIINSQKQYYNDENEDSYVGFDSDDNKALDMATRALEVVQGIAEAFLQELPGLDMRDATEEERNSLKRYIDSISQSTGVKFDYNGVKTELEPCDDCVSREALKERFRWLEKATKYDNKDAEQQHFSYSTMMMYEIKDEIDNVIDSLPSVQPQSLEQIKWERDTAIEQLKQLGYGLGEKVEPCEDCVSRKETIEWLKKVTVTDGITFKTGFEQILYDIEQMPSVKPQRPPGKWLDKKMTIKGAHGMAYGRYACSVCKKKFPNKSNYCPNCGAEMEGEE